MIMIHYFIPYRYKIVGENVFLVEEIPHKEAYSLTRNLGEKTNACLDIKFG